MPDLHPKMTGVAIIVEIYDQTGEVVDLSTITAGFIYFRDPRGRVKKQTAQLVSGGSTGRMKYTLASVTDLSIAGDWAIEAEYTNSAGTFITDAGSLTVTPVIF